MRRQTGIVSFFFNRKFFWEHCKSCILTGYLLFIYGKTIKWCYNVKWYNLSFFKRECGLILDGHFSYMATPP